MSQHNINLRSKNIFEEGELEEDSTIKDFLIVRQEGKMQSVLQAEIRNTLAGNLFF